MIGNVVICALPECDEKFVKITHNQKYHSAVCTRIATNRNIMEKYHERSAIKRGLKRQCASCGTSLSRYNETKICAPCQSEKKEKTDNQVQDMVAAINWL